MAATSKQTQAILELEEEIIRYFVYNPEDSKGYVMGIDIEDFVFPHTQRIFSEVQSSFAKGKTINRTMVLQEISSDSIAVGTLDFPPRVTDLEIRQYVEKLKDVSSKRKIVQYLTESKAMIETKKTSARDFAGSSIDFFRDVVQTSTVLDTEAIDLTSYISAHRKILEEARNGVLDGVTTGMRILDNYLNGGLKKGDLVLVGARPSVGKTSFTLTLALNAALAGSKVMFISAEMRPRDIVDRMLAFYTGKPLTEITRGMHKERVEEAYERFAKINFKIVDAPRFTSRDVIGIATREKYVNGLDLVVVDYLQYLADSAGKQSEAVRVGRISRNLKSLAGSLDIPVVSPSQLNRQSEHRIGSSKGVPSLEDLRDSGSLEQDADVVMLLHRKDDEPGKAFLRIAKNRKGETGAMKLDFDMRTTKFSEMNISGL